MFEKAMKKPEMHLFTPFVSKDSKLKAYMKIDDDDYSMIRRGQHWSAIITDHLSGGIYEVEAKTCDASDCYCQAVIIGEVQEGKDG